MDQQNENEAGGKDSDGSTKLTSAEKFCSSFIAGALAGAIAKTVIAPLDRTKINFQITSRKFSSKKAIYFMIESYKSHGLFSLWRGNSATMARIMPYAAVQFAAHEQWKKVLKVDDNAGRKRHPERLFAAGSLAGMTSVLATYPLDLARARMAVTQRFMYKTITEVFLKIVKNEGISKLYKGFIPTIVGVIPYAGTSFFTYESFKRLHAERNDTDLHPMERLAFGAIAGLVGQTSSYPLDIVRRRMQTDAVTGKSYKSILSALITIAREEGIIGGLYKGLSLNWIKGPIAVGISFTTFDLTQNFLQKIPLYVYR